MNTDEKTPEKESTEANEGFFKRIFTKVDTVMKAKADAAAQDSCCSGKDKDGNKCC